MTQVTLDVQYLFDADRGFRPPPKVDSSIIRLTPKGSDSAGYETELTVLRLAFAGRRKRMSNALGDIEPRLAEAVGRSGLRADDVTIEHFLMIAGQVESRQGQSSSQE